jgi:ATP-dependent Lhr-like helicase
MPTRLAAPALTRPALLRALHPGLAAWFRGRFSDFSPAQHFAVPEILAARTTLVSSPTGSGKTLSAFLGIFDHLVRAHETGTLPDGVVAIYVSPLRALAYDLQKNLHEPAAQLGWPWLRIGARTGDTTAAERARQRRHPPHLLVTTPESLTLLLSQPAWEPFLRTTRFLIVDELHALAENKRGSLLMVSAERLETMVEKPLTRIGLSATVAPLETVAAFLAGPGRPCSIAEITEHRPARIEVFSPLRANAYPPAGFTATRVLRELADLLKGRRTTLIFTNTRSGAESIGLRLKQLLPDLADEIEVHHASLDREVRLEVEDRLKRGELRAVVCSTSLELGIDIGAIDTVVMVSAPKGVSRALQRLGRSGHSLDRTSHGVLVATNINDLAECAATARLMTQRAAEPVRPHDNPLDVLAQTLVGLAVSGRYTPESALALVRRSYPFRSLAPVDFDRILRYLAGGGASLETRYRDTFGKVILNDEGHLAVPSPRIARDLFQNVGTIVSEPMAQVRLGSRNLGQVEESFVKGLREGDVFVLNGRCVRVNAIRLLSVFVSRADSSLPTVPRWYANKMPLASGVAAEVSRLRSELSQRLATPEAATWLTREYNLSASNAAALVSHFELQTKISIIPTADFLLIELYRPPLGDLVHVFFHSLIGRSANDALSRIIAQRVRDTVGGNALVTIDDYGFLLTLKSFQALETVEAWRPLFVRANAEEAMRTALSESNLVKWQFRGVSQTGLMVPRRVHGAERGARSLQWSSEIIFDVLRRYEPDHPLLAEAYAEVTLRFLDLPRALAFLETAATLPWRLQVIERVSPFSFGIFVSKIKETMMLEDPETTIERLFHEMYGSHSSSAHGNPA